jgi:chemotaxis protein MotB
MTAQAHGRPIVIKRKKVVQAHHGGTWKIALADFMTALMALFLVLWLIGNASEAELEGIAEYFNTPLRAAITGGERNTGAPSIIPGGGADPAHQQGERLRLDRRQETRPADTRRNFHELQRRIEAAIIADPELRQLLDQVRFDITPEGLRVQFLDSDRRPMFELGSAQVEVYMGKLLRTIAPMLNELPHKISISGHTDSLAFAGGDTGYSNWELSADRANASRRELIAGGLKPERLLRVTGMADRVPLPGKAASDPINRRIALMVLDQQVVEEIRRHNTLEAHPVALPGYGGDRPYADDSEKYQDGDRQASGYVGERSVSSFLN